MKADLTTKYYKKIGVELNHKNINKEVKAVIHGRYIVKNDNFGTRRKYADFTNGKKEVGIHPLTIVFADLECAMICHDKYINANDEVCDFADWNKN